MSRRGCWAERLSLIAGQNAKLCAFKNRLPEILNLEFFVDNVAILAHSTRRDHQLGSDLLVAQSLSHQGQDIYLAVRQ